MKTAPAARRSRSASTTPMLPTHCATLSSSTISGQSVFVSLSLSFARSKMNDWRESRYSGYFKLYPGKPASSKNYFVSSRPLSLDLNHRPVTAPPPTAGTHEAELI